MKVNNKVKFIFILFISCRSFITSAQKDTLLSFKQYIDLVKDHHPLSYAASLQKNYAEANQLMVKGGFDPKAGAFYDRKRFEDKTYFNVLSTGITVPTWYGIEVKSYYDRNEGSFVNNADRLPVNGLFTVGLSFPLARGLVIDERRAELKRAAIFTQSTQANRSLIINDLYYDATIAYLEWQLSKKLTDIAKEGLEFAKVRLEGTKSLFYLGDKPAIDTLEIFILKTVREQELLEAEQNLINARLALNNFLWLDGVTPMEMNNAVIPDSLDLQFLLQQVNDILIDETWLANHPEINLALLKIKELELDLKLVKEQLKPDLRLNYNPLITANNSYIPAGYNANDFKIGASFYYPLFLRKERGKVRFTSVKIDESEYKLELKKLELRNKFLSYTTNNKTLEEQIKLTSLNVNNYSTMLKAENRLFQLGESSVFLVNSREVSYLQSKIKEVETVFKLLKNRLTILYISNQLLF
jgi:outer membrane protein TolC